jgi:hypothetical protein
MEIHVIGKQSKMGAVPKSRVVDVELTDSAHRAHGGADAGDQIGERPSGLKVGLSQPRCCRVECGQWNLPLMGPALPIGPASEPGLCSRFGEAREVPEVPELADGLVAVAMNVVLDDCGKRANLRTATKSAAAWVRPSVAG